MSAEIKWTKDIETGIAEIDLQHKKFFGLMNALLSLAIAGHEAEKIHESIAALKRYIRYHFSLEEELMIQSKYPAYKEHLGAHRYFKEELAKMDALCKDQKEPHQALMTRYNYMLVDWFLRHIKLVDKKMAAHLVGFSEQNKSFIAKMAEILRKPFSG